MKHLSEWMDEQDLTDREVAERLDLQRSTVTKLRQGTVLPSLPVAIAIEDLTKGQVKPRSFVPRD